MHFQCLIAISKRKSHHCRPGEFCPRQDAPLFILQLNQCAFLSGSKWGRSGSQQGQIIGGLLSPVIFRAGTRENSQSANVEIPPEVGAAYMGELSEEPERSLELRPSITLDERVSREVKAMQFQ